MRVAFLTQDLQLSGGVGVVVEHARRLSADHGFEVTLVTTRPDTRSAWDFAGLEHLRVLDLESAAGVEHDVALATWWETARSLFEVPRAATPRSCSPSRIASTPPGTRGGRPRRSPSTCPSAT